MRYGAQWKRWFAQVCDRRGIDYEFIDGKQLKGFTDEIKTGQFLDAHNTNYWKLTQLANVVEKLYDGQIDHGDIIFDFDLWHTGLQCIPYITSITKQNIEVHGIMHAGTYDPTDFIAKKGMGVWGAKFEQSIFNFVNTVFVGTNHHANRLLKNRNANVFISGLPFNSRDVIKEADLANGEKKDRVVFPCRWSSDKMPHVYMQIKERVQSKNRDIEFVETHKNNFSKSEYYKIMRDSKVVLSTADHENFGIGVIEAMTLECLPIVPLGRSYDDYVPEPFMYVDPVVASILVERAVQNYDATREKYNFAENVRKYDYSIDAMLNEMGFGGY